MRYSVILADPPWRFERWGSDTGNRATERLYPRGPYLELFARRRRSGRDSWGNEVESDVLLAGSRQDAP